MVEALPNYKKSNFWWYENLDSTRLDYDSTWSNWIQKD